MPSTPGIKSGSQTLYMRLLPLWIQLCFWSVKPMRFWSMGRIRSMRLDLVTHTRHEQGRSELVVISLDYAQMCHINGVCIVKREFINALATVFAMSAVSDERTCCNARAWFWADLHTFCTWSLKVRCWSSVTPGISTPFEIRTGQSATSTYLIAVGHFFARWAV